MRGFGGPARLALVLAIAFALILMISGASFTALSVSDPDASDSSNDIIQETVYECPYPQAQGSGDSDEIIKECKDVLGSYVTRTEEMEKEMEILRKQIMLFIEGECEFSRRVKSMEDVKSVVKPEAVRNLAVFVISNSRKDPVSSLYEYVRMNFMCIEDPEGEEYIASPCETVLTGGGDCEDHSILLVSLLKAVGVESKILWIAGEHTFAAIRVPDKGEIEALCENPMYLDIGDERFVLADTTFSNCVGKISGDYFGGEAGEWEWKEGNEPVIFDI
jgi:hypothetical protein